MTLSGFLLASHIGGGTVALFSGPLALLSRKGSPPHRRAGRVYAAAMAVAASSAFALAAATRDVFLLALAAFALFQVFSGVRAVSRPREAGFAFVDRAAVVLAAAFSASLFAWGAARGDVAGLFFGAGGLLLTARRWRLSRDVPADRLTAHIASMGGAYIATITAFLVVNNAFLPRAFVFVAPTLIGAPLIVWAARRAKLGASGA